MNEDSSALWEAMHEIRDRVTRIEALWEAMHEIRDRVTRIEERSVNRDEKISGMAGKVDEMHKFFLQSQGGFKTATAMTKYAYGTCGAIFAFVIANWEWIKRFFRIS